jgi:hypothetical protein
MFGIVRPAFSALLCAFAVKSDSHRGMTFNRKTQHQTRKTCVSLSSSIQIDESLILSKFDIQNWTFDIVFSETEISNMADLL